MNLEPTCPKCGGDARLVWASDPRTWLCADRECAARFGASGRVSEYPGDEHDVLDLPRPFGTWAELQARGRGGAAPQVVARGLAWAGRVTLLVSREGIGKSTLAGAAAAAVSAGDDWLGVSTMGGLVVVLNVEEHLDDSLRRLEAFGGDPLRVVHGSGADCDQLLGSLSSVAARIRPTLIVVDSLAAVGEREGITEAGSSAQWQPLLQRLVRIARDSNAAVLVLHHARKDGDDYRDSTAIGAAVDVVALLREPGRGEPATLRRIHYRKARWPLEDLAVRFTGGGFVAAGETTLEDEIAIYVAENAGCSIASVRRGVPGGSTKIVAAVKALLVSGRLLEEAGERGARCLFPPGAVAGAVAETLETPVGLDRARCGRGGGRGTTPDPYMGVSGAVVAAGALTPENATSNAPDLVEKTF